jgi:hypothetical protein
VIFRNLSSLANDAKLSSQPDYSLKASDNTITSDVTSLLGSDIMTSKLFGPQSPSSPHSLWDLKATDLEEENAKQPESSSNHILALLDEKTGFPSPEAMLEYSEMDKKDSHPLMDVPVKTLLAEEMMMHAIDKGDQEDSVPLDATNIALDLTRSYDDDIYAAWPAGVNEEELIPFVETRAHQLMKSFPLQHK